MFGYLTFNVKYYILSQIFYKKIGCMLYDVLSKGQKISEVIFFTSTYLEPKNTIFKKLFVCKLFLIL